MLQEIEQIIEAIGERVDPSSPLDVWCKLEKCVSLLGNAARIEAEAQMNYASERNRLLLDNLVRKSDSTGHIESYMPSVVEQKSLCENLQRNLKEAIEGLRTMLSYLKTEENNSKNYQ